MSLAVTFRNAPRMGAVDAGAREASPTGGSSSAPALVTALTVAIDAAAGLVAWGLALPHSVGSGMLAVGLMGLWSAGTYREQLRLRVLDVLPRIVVAIGMAALVVVLGVELVAPEALPGVVGGVVRAAALWAAIAVLGRHVSYTVARSWRRRSIVNHGTVFVGLDKRSADLASSLLDDPSLGLRPVGFLTSVPPRDEDLPAPHLGGIDSLAQVVDRTGAAHVVVDAGALAPGEVVAAVQECDRRDIEVFVVPGASEVLGGRTQEHIDGIPVFRLPRRPFRTVQWALKRALDVVVALLGLAILSPLMLVAGLLVRRETGAGVLFRQPRVGLDGRHFDVLKLQTMVPATAGEAGTRWSIANDTRLGPVGRFLRRTSIDELPQLLNVLRGEMSLVGPRPERPHFVEVFQRQYPRYMARHRVPSGVTGMAQVEGLRGDTSIAQRVAYDNLYIEQWSLWLDIKILLRTVPAVLRGEGG